MSVIVKGMKIPTRCIDCPFMVSRENDDCIVQSDEANAKAETWEDVIANCPLIELPEKHGRLIDIYVRDKVTNEIRRVGDDQHDMLTITDANELVYHNLQNGDGCRTGDDCGGYEFVPNEDEYGYNADPREEGDHA